MKWTKQWVILVIVIFTASYIYSIFYENNYSKQIKTNKLRNCAKNDTCEIIEVYHDTCFKKSYRSYIKTMRFYEKEYDKCIKEKKTLCFKQSLS